MNNNVIRNTHPLVVIAALSVTLFSFAGIAALMGWLPASKGSAPDTLAEAALAPTASTPSTAVQPAPAAKKPAPRRVVRESHETVFHEPVRPPVYTEPVRSTPEAPRVAAPPVCHDCGTIENVRAIEQEGKPSGLGAVAGGVLGGILGHQVGGGRGKDLMTVVGAVGGAVAGHQVEKKTRTTQAYEVTVRFEDGTTRSITESQAPAWRIGDRVRVVDGQILRAETL